MQRGELEVVCEKEESAMKQRRINATLTVVLALATLLIFTALPLAGTAAPTVASLSTNPKRINESAEAYSFIRSPFVDSFPGTTTHNAFMAKLDTFSCDTVTEIPQVECEALVALYNSTNGANWSNNSGWMDTNTPCNWYGVTCSSGHVTQLDLYNNQLSGSIPPELGNLANLRWLTLSNNQLSGSIPPELGSLTNLLDLYLDWNQLSGSIPPELGNLANLQDLDLSNNQLSGSIPPELGNLTNLQHLRLSNNQLSGSIPPELGNLANLHYLHLSNTHLSGSIPPELGNLANLRWLTLSNNQLSGSIPPELGNLANLQDELRLDNNQLSGSIPPELGDLTNLPLLYLFNNQLSGSIPPELGNLANLHDLHLYNNQLSGSIPPELGNLANLNHLHLDNNQLSGSIPPELGNLANSPYLYLYLSNNQLSGSIPPELGNLANLWGLELDNNQLSGSIPPQLGNLANLHYLYLDNNQFSGALPGSLTNLAKLYRFWFHNTDLCEPADAAFQTWLAGIGDLKSTGVICPPTDKPPVVLVHGWQGLGIPGIHGNTCTITPTRVYPGTNRFFGNLPQWLYDLGYTEIYEVNLTTGPGHTPRFEENAECLRRQLESVTGGTRKAILIAHSMGGLVSRAYMENENLYGKDVARLVTLGSPHAGINWEFLIKILLGLKAPEAVAAYCFIDPGTCQLSTEQVLLFDLKHNSRAPGVLYDLIGGRKTPFPLGWLFSLTDGPNDGLVGLASATGKTYWTDLKVVNGKFVSRYQTNETHCPMVGHPHYFEGDAGETRSCIRYLLGGSGTGGSCVQATAMMVQAQAPAIAYSLDVRGHITSSQTVTHSLQVDADGASLFYLSWVTGTLGITLTNPVGTVIDPAYAAANTDVVTYTTSPGSEMTPPFAAYAFTTTVPGLYTATITADDVGITGTDYLLFAAMETTRTLSVALDGDHYQIGDTAVLTATLEGTGGGISGATVQATFSRSDAITDTLTLTDQGDGTYRGTYAISNAPGYLHLRVTAEGSDAGTQFNRQVDRLLTVASQAVQLTGTYADRADDADGNGRYETLTVDVEVLAAGAGDFTFSADLVAGGDQFVAHVITQTALITGTQSVPLRFDGELIRDGGSDGPFTVTNLLISDPQNAGIPSVMADDVWTTAAYDHTQFGRITGDMNGDCIVTVVDIMLVASRWNTSIGDIRYDGLYDLDNSGNIDVADIMFVAAHWREKCE